MFSLQYQNKSWKVYSAIQKKSFPLLRFGAHSQMKHLRNANFDRKNSSVEDDSSLSKLLYMFYSTKMISRTPVGTVLPTILGKRGAPFYVQLIQSESITLLFDGPKYQNQGLCHSFPLLVPYQVRLIWMYPQRRKVYFFISIASKTTKWNIGRIMELM